MSDDIVFPKDPIIVIKDGKTYIQNLKIMTAQNFYKDNKIIKVDPMPPIGWFASEKYDGIRAIWNGKQFVSRGSTSGLPKVYSYVPDFILNIMPMGVALDGEIWLARNKFSEVSGLSNIKPGGKYKKEDIDNKWKLIKYKIFDIPNSEMIFEDRIKLLESIINERKKLWSENFNFPLEIVNHHKITSEEEVYKLFNDLTLEGAEGIMLRAPNSKYEQKRSKYLLKFKIQDDAEAVVKNYSLGTGKYKDKLGALVCALILKGKETNIIFNIGTGLTDEHRNNYNNNNNTEYNIPIGSIVSFSYMELTKDNIPRHPAYRGIRLDMAYKKDYREDIINMFETYILNLQKTKEANWQFKKKAYNNVLEIIKKSKDIIETTDDALNVLRTNGLKLENKSSVIDKINKLLNNEIVLEESNKNKSIKQLVQIPEIGPSKAEKLYEMGIETIDELNKAYLLKKDILTDKQALGLKYYKDLQIRIPREEMNKWNDFFEKLFIKTQHEIKIEGYIKLVGSYRRLVESSGDIDILVTSKNNQKEIMTKLLNNLYETEITNKKLTFSSGITKYMGLGKIDQYYRHIDIFYYSEKEYPFALLFSTGSGEFNVEMRAYALKNKYSLSEKNLKHNSSKGVLVSTEEYLLKIDKEYPTTEEDIFNFLNLEYVEPNKRKSGMIKILK